MPDSNHLRGTSRTRQSMFLDAGVRGGLGLALIVVAVAAPLTGMGTLGLVLVGLLGVFTGLHRLVWAVRGSKVDLLTGFCVAWLVLIVGSAALAPWLPLPEGRNATAALSQPIYLGPFQYVDHILGTNSAGLDLFSRSIWGARTSLTVALTAIVIGVAIGGILGVIAGFYRKGVDRTISIFTNAFLAVPPLILLIAVATILDPGVRNLAFALSLLTIPGMVRIARANTISFAQREFVLAARAMGATRLRIMWRELVPNVALPLLSMAVVTISALIVAEASLSFLGLGVRQPEPTWGNMISEAQAGDTMKEHPFIFLVPGAFLFITVFSFNLLGEKAQQRWDTRSAKL